MVNSYSRNIANPNEMDKKIIMIVGNWYYPKMVYQSLIGEFNIDHVIVDKGESTSKFLRRRINRLGITHVVGQLLFRIFAVSYINKTSKKRFQEILDENDIVEKEFDPQKTTKIDSINSEAGHALLRALNPDIVVIVTTRILSKKTLQAIDANFVNIHSGITPVYRGVHGGYWALVNKDYENCGVTVHLVDEGIDTGTILYQETITNKLTPKDNFMTYSYLQLAKALPLLKQAIRDIQSGNMRLIAHSDKHINSNLYYHPTLWFYLYHRWFKGVK